MIVCANCGEPPRENPRAPFDPTSPPPDCCRCGLLVCDSTMGAWLLVPKRCALYIIDGQAVFRDHLMDEKRKVRDREISDLVSEMIVWSVVDS